MSLHLPKVQNVNTVVLGRGIGSGVGKTGGRGIKGQKSRKSGGVVQVSKAVKQRFIVVYLNSVSLAKSL